MACVLRPSPDIQIFDTGLLSLAAVRSLWEHASPAVLRPAASPTAAVLSRVACAPDPDQGSSCLFSPTGRRFLLDDHQFDEWMRGSPDQAVTLLTPYPGMIEAREVGAD